MEIKFRKKKLKESCESEKELQKSYGKPNAEKIMNSLAYKIFCLFIQRV